MTAAVEFPRALLREHEGRWSLRGNIISGGQTAAGAFTRISMDGGGVWQMQYDGIALRTREHILMGRAVERIADGGVTPLIMPMCDTRYAPVITLNGVPVSETDPLPHSDDAFFSDDSGYAQSLGAVAFTGAAALHATEFPVEIVDGYDLTLDAGQYFSLIHPTQGKRLYSIIGVQDVDDTIMLTIRPPLREAVDAGTTLDFRDLGCVMVLQSPADMDMTLSLRRTASWSVKAIEYIYPVM